MTEFEIIIAQQKEIIDFFVIVKPKLEDGLQDILKWQTEHQRQDEENYRALNDNIMALDTKISTFNKYYTGVGVVGIFVGFITSLFIKSKS